MQKKFNRLDLVLPIILPLISLAPLYAIAESIGPINFEAPTYTVGSINGQDGWMSTGAFDQGVVANTSAPASFGAQSFRISDAVTSGSFGDQTFAKPLIDSAGEADSTSGTYSPGIKQPHFEAQFDIASTLPDEQVGMHMTVSPDRGDGSRMSYLRFDDMSDGIHVFFADTTDPGPVGTVATFNETDIATLTRTAHTIKITMDLLDGPSNDVVKVYIDGVLEITGTSWEDYYRYDPESAAEQSPRIIKTLMFRESGTAHPANLGNGFLIDNLTLLSGPAPVPPQITGSISGMKYNDLNRNGRKNTGEPGLAGWVIRLKSGHTVLTTTTDANGNYSFDNLAPGTYTVRETHQHGWKRMSKNPKKIVISADSTVSGVNFGNAKKHKGEKDDDDNDDNLDEESGNYYGNHGRSNYENDRDRRDNDHNQERDNGNNSHR